MRRTISNQRGFTLIDAMIVCVILAISLLAVATIQTEYMKRQSVYLKRMIGQNLLASFVSDIQTQGRLYPYLMSNGKPVTYVFCYGKDGIPLQSSTGELGAQVVTTAIDHLTPSTICAKSGAIILGYELHLVRVDANYADVYVIGLQNENPQNVGGKVSYTVRVYVPQTF